MSKSTSNSEKSLDKSVRVVAVYGASGHTGRFVVSELRRRGWGIIAVGRGLEKLRALSRDCSGLQIQAASIDNPNVLDKALGSRGGHQLRRAVLGYRRATHKGRLSSAYFIP